MDRIVGIHLRKYIAKRTDNCGIEECVILSGCPLCCVKEVLLVHVSVPSGVDKGLEVSKVCKIVAITCVCSDGSLVQEVLAIEALLGIISSHSSRS